MKKSRIKAIVQICIIVLLSFFSMMAFKAHFNGLIDGNLESNCMDSFRWEDIVVFIIMFGFWYCLYLFIKMYYFKIQKLIIRDKPYMIKSLYCWLVVTLILLIAWLPYLMSFAPGSVLGDSMSSVGQVFSGQYSNHHPVVYTLLVGFFVKIGMRMGDINIGIFLYSLFQYLFLATTLAYVVVFLMKHRVNPWLLGLAVFFFAICPIFPSYAIIMWKDPLFSIGLLFIGIILYWYAKNDFKNMKWYQYSLLVFSVLVVAFFRNNGIFILVFVLLALLIMYRKRVWKVALTITLTMGFSLIIQGPIYSIFHIYKPSVEAFAIPLQQVAYTIVDNEGSLSDSDREFMNKIMPLEIWKKVYSPTLVDSIKWHKDFDTIFFEEHIIDFMKIWLKLLPNNLNGYIDAYLLETLGFWHPIYQNEYGYIDQYISENSFGINEVDLIEEVFGFSVKDGLKKYRPMISTGLMVFVSLFSLLICLEYQWKRVVLLYLSSIFCWGIIMVSTPVAFSLRYMFVVMLMLPIIITCPFFQLERVKKAQNNDIMEA